MSTIATGLASLWALLLFGFVVLYGAAIVWSGSRGARLWVARRWCQWRDPHTARATAREPWQFALRQWTDFGDMGLQYDKTQGITHPLPKERKAA